MPLYEYRCATCDERFDLIRRWMEADKPAECPSCKTETGQRALAAPAPTPGSGSSGGFSTASSGGCSPRGGFT